MGQLEKYGLYVLCLVIFLILGVTIWGGGELPQANRRAPVSADLNVGPGGSGPGRSGPGGSGPGGSVGRTQGAPVQTGNMASLLGLTSNDPKNDPKNHEGRTPPVSGGGSSGDVGGTKGEASASGDKSKEPAPVKSPVANEVRPTHKVQSGDSFESIAKKAYGSAALRTEIARLNPRVEPTRMRLGQELQLPTKAEAEQFLGRASSAVVDASKAVTSKAVTSKVATKEVAGKEVAGKEVAIREASAKNSPAVPAIVAGATYTVAKGDTLEGIAIHQLGSRSRLDDLREANPNVDPTKMKVGLKIRLPKK